MRPSSSATVSGWGGTWGPTAAPPADRNPCQSCETTIVAGGRDLPEFQPYEVAYAGLRATTRLSATPPASSSRPPPTSSATSSPVNGSSPPSSELLGSDETLGTFFDVG